MTRRCPGHCASGVETVRAQCEKGATKDAAIQTLTPDSGVAISAGKHAALRLVALVLTWALLLLPLSLAGPLPEHRDWHASATVADIGNAAPILSSYDRNQAALRSFEAKQSAKSCGGWGKAPLAQAQQTLLCEAGRHSTFASSQAVASEPRFAAFSARAPPRRV